MSRNFLAIPVSEVRVDASAAHGPLELWRHTLGHGGINALPLPPRVVEGVSQLKPRLIRIFLQEHFDIYPAHGEFNWSKLDPYMAALAQTGAKVVAAITIKPPVLFPQIDESIWQPNDVAEWQRLIHALVHRYSVEQPIVTYWEIGNEMDIGENGGSPYLMPVPADYNAYYRFTVKPILEAFPEAKVGGPALASVNSPLLPGLIEDCAQTGTPLHFVSWHLYSNSPERHAAGVTLAKSLLDRYPGPRPEMLITEWAKGFEYRPDDDQSISVEDMAFVPRRAAITAASILAMLDAGLDWSFYYHIWDQAFYPDASWKSFFSERGLNIMLRHWNEVPHKFGLFGVNGEARPMYFVYWLLAQLGDERIEIGSEEDDVRVLAARDASHEGDAVKVMLINLNASESKDRVINFNFSGLDEGRKQLVVHRIDESFEHNAARAALTLEPIETREVYTLANFNCQVFLPADSVALLSLIPVED